MFRAFLGLVSVILVCLALLVSSHVRALLISAGVSAETEGLWVAQENGCFYCHGPWGSGKVPNPGAQTIPGFQDFAFMMSIDSEYELREWILFGAPRALRSQDDFEAKKSNRSVHMPAYQSRLSERDLDRLIDFYHGVSGTIWPRDNNAEQGYELARDAGCFSCHGPGGRFDLPNPGSLVGRIPSWHGGDFDDLVRSDEELREWILDGVPRRLAENRIAAWFIERQVVKMPAYRGKLSEAEVEAVINYIRWLRDPDAPGHRPAFGSFEDSFNEF